MVVPTYWPLLCHLIQSTAMIPEPTSASVKGLEFCGSDSAPGAFTREPGDEGQRGHVRVEHREGSIALRKRQWKENAAEFLLSRAIIVN